MGLDMYLESPSSDEFYWRKVNAVHRFFVEKYLDKTGQELKNCVSIEVPVDWIRELCSRIMSVLQWKDNAEELLPTQSGFFFGSTEYDETYYKDLLIVLRDCLQLLSEVDENELDHITYTAWW